MATKTIAKQELRNDKNLKRFIKAGGRKKAKTDFQKILKRAANTKATTLTKKT